MKAAGASLERSYGTFERIFTIPETVDAEAVKADYKNGTLTVTLPKQRSSETEAGQDPGELSLNGRAAV